MPVFYDLTMPKKWKVVLFLIAGLVFIALAIGPLLTLVKAGKPADYYSHIPFVPVISAFVLFKRRNSLFDGDPRALLPGLSTMILGLGLVIVDSLGTFGPIAQAELRAGGGILFLWGAYLALFGTRAFGKALFPLLFLLFVIPLPLSWIDHIVSSLVMASTGITNLIFRGLEVPFVQEGSIFRLPGFDIEVARECSGIRSSLALLITSVLAGQIFLSRRWKKTLLALAVFPVTVLKNAVRIVTLYLLSYFVDMRIIEGGFLHRSGGFVFFGLGSVLLTCVLWLLGGPRESGKRPLEGPIPPSKGT
jgi:exosortase